MTATSDWCWLCLTPRSRATDPPFGAMAWEGRPQRADSRGTRRDLPGSRWRKSAITFGPLGRVCWTGALLVPLVVFVQFLVVGVVVYGGIILPWALRDLWQKDR